MILIKCATLDCPTILGCRVRSIDIKCGDNESCTLVRIFDACPITSGHSEFARYGRCKKCGGESKNETQG
jgi:hypothetical protein